MKGTRVQGGKVNLRPLRDDDLDRRVQWLKDEETFRLLTGSLPSRAYRRVDAERWRLGLEADGSAIVFAVETKAGRHIGDIDLHGIDVPERAAKLTVLLGDKAFWDGGYGTDAVLTLLGYAFSDLGLQCVKLRVYEFNGRAIRCYEKCGFRRTGSTAGDARFGFRPAEVLMSVAKQEFLASHPHANAFQT